MMMEVVEKFQRSCSSALQKRSTNIVGINVRDL